MPLGAAAGALPGAAVEETGRGISLHSWQLSQAMGHASCRSRGPALLPASAAASPPCLSHPRPVHPPTRKVRVAQRGASRDALFWVVREQAVEQVDAGVRQVRQLLRSRGGDVLGFEGSTHACALAHTHIAGGCAAAAERKRAASTPIPKHNTSTPTTHTHAHTHLHTHTFRR